MSEHRVVFIPAARSSLSHRHRWTAGALGALAASGLLFGGLARAASPSDLAGGVRLDVWADVHGGWVGGDGSVSGAAVPGGVSMRLASSAEVGSGADASVDVDATADVDLERNPAGDPPPVPDPGPDPTPLPDPGPDPTPLPDPGPDPTPLPDPVTVPDPAPVVTPDPGGVVLPTLDPPVAPGTDPGERCASSRTTPRCGDDHDSGGDPTGGTGGPQAKGSTTAVAPAAIDAGGANEHGPGPLEQVLGRDVERTAPPSAESPAGNGTPTPAGTTLPKTGGGTPIGALRVLGLAALGRALLSRTCRRRAAGS